MWPVQAKMRMLNPARVTLTLLLLALAGCASRQDLNRAGDWEDLSASATGAYKPGVALSPSAGPGAIANSVASAAKPVASKPAPPLETGSDWIALSAWCKSSGLPLPTRQTAASQPTFSTLLPEGNLTLRAGSESLSYRGIDVRLGFAPQLIDGELHVNSLDLKKTLRPLLPASGLFQLSSAPVIVIDAGHGGQNGGTRSVYDNQLEKELTLDWANRVQALLASMGWVVRLTRTNDADLSLPERVAIADACRADLFVSLHFNSAGEKAGEAGVETYCLTPVGMTSTVTRGFPDEAGFAYPNNEFDAQNLALSFRVHSALSRIASRDRGVRRARFLGILRPQQRPAILVEGGYLSNPEEARLISTPEYRQKLANAVVKGLLACVPADPVQATRMDGGIATDPGKRAGGQGF